MTQPDFILPKTFKVPLVVFQLGFEWRMAEEYTCCTFYDYSEGHSGKSTVFWVHDNKIVSNEIVASFKEVDMDMAIGYELNGKFINTRYVSFRKQDVLNYDKKRDVLSHKMTEWEMRIGTMAGSSTYTILERRGFILSKEQSGVSIV